jgi:hypothetical protein
MKATNSPQLVSSKINRQRDGNITPDEEYAIVVHFSLFPFFQLKLTGRAGINTDPLEWERPSSPESETAETGL